MFLSNSGLTADSEYAVKRNEVIGKNIPDTEKFNWQQHHDYYVKLYFEYQKLQKQLSEKELRQFELAKLREWQKVVNPLVGMELMPEMIGK